MFLAPLSAPFARLALWLFLSLSASFSFAQSSVTLSGKITDAATGETIIGANVIPDGMARGTSSNAYGFFSLTLPSGEQTIRVSFIGYQPLEVQLKLSESSAQNFELRPAVVAFEEATVVGEKSNRTQSTDLGLESVDIEQIKALPALLGEVDVLKVLQFLPGVSSAGEGNSGFYVRGGGPDQNLILLDDATIYNASHLFGFLASSMPMPLKMLN